jgi:ketosteroid isomerase-like protein
MSHPRRLALFACALLPIAVGTAGAGEEEERAELRALKGLYEQAVNEDKVSLLLPHVDPEFRGVMLTSEPVTGADGLAAYWAKIKGMMGPAGHYRVAVTTEPALFFGDIAIAHGTSDDTVTLPGKEYHFAGQWTAVCRKRDGAWKLFRLHASMDPLSNAFVLDRVKAGRWAFGGVVLVGGLLAGAVAGFVLGRRGRAA